MKTLRDVKTGETVQVVKLHGEGAVKRRIMDMGITKGCTVYVRKVAPLGDPVEVTIRGYELSIRKGDAELIEVDVVEEHVDSAEVVSSEVLLLAIEALSDVVFAKDFDRLKKERAGPASGVIDLVDLLLVPDC